MSEEIVEKIKQKLAEIPRLEGRGLGNEAIHLANLKIERIKRDVLKILEDHQQKLQELFSKIEPCDHQVSNPQYFHIVLTKHEKEELAKLLGLPTKKESKP
jgi:hypothetical protein